MSQFSYFPSTPYTNSNSKEFTMKSFSFIGSPIEI